MYVPSRRGQHSDAHHPRLDILLVRQPALFPATGLRIEHGNLSLARRQLYQPSCSGSCTSIHSRPITFVAWTHVRILNVYTHERDTSAKDATPERWRSIIIASYNYRKNPPNFSLRLLKRWRKTINSYRLKVPRDPYETQSRPRSQTARALHPLPLTSESDGVFDFAASRRRLFFSRPWFLRTGETRNAGNAVRPARPLTFVRRDR